jgi:hypothetical protein
MTLPMRMFSRTVRELLVHLDDGFKPMLVPIGTRIEVSQDGKKGRHVTKDDKPYSPWYPIQDEDHELGIIAARGDKK